jgi:23S rRNA pseudouridine1911/1915/1917 synthase
MTYTVENSESGGRLDIFVHDMLLKDYSREYVIRLIKDQSITVGGRKVKAGFRLSAGDIIEINASPPEAPSSLPQDIPLDIIYEDDDIIVINKPKGMVVHPGNGNHNNTLVNAVMYHTGSSLSSVNGPIRPGIVHRIDKDTSGLLVVAKNDNAHRSLAKQFKDHSITREYLAVCEGLVEHNRIRIIKAVSRNKNDRRKMDIDPEGKNAISDITVIERLKNAAYISVRLETGRTHQIRIHMKSIGHPLAGDTKYGTKSPYIQGQALHAARLGFIHPSTNEYMEFYKDPPKDFCDLIAFLK